MTTAIELLPVTSRQREVLAWIARATRERGFPPTLREGQAEFAFKSPNGFLCHVVALERKKLLTRSSSSRTIVLTEAGHDALV